MLENFFSNYVLPAQRIPNVFVVAMGVGTVFLGLICIILICKIMSALCAPRKTRETAVTESTVPKVETIENRQEIIAAVSAVIAEELGTDISAIRIHSFKKI